MSSNKINKKQEDKIKIDVLNQYNKMNKNNIIPEELHNLIQNNESDNESNDESDDESENESDDESNNKNIQVKENIKQKSDKKEKINFEQIIKDIKDYKSKIIINNDNIDKLKKEIKILENYNLHNEKHINKLFNLIEKAHEESVNKARKEKKKRTNSARKGILEPLPVPSIIAEFLNIDSTILLDRTKIMSLLNTKFKEKGLKSGQITTLDKTTADQLGVEEGFIIEFKNFHKFISSYYKKEIQLVDLNN